MRTVLATFAAIVWVLAALSPADSQTAAANSPAVAAARARQESVNTLCIEFKQTEVIARGGKSENMAGPFKSKDPVPNSETTVESINRLVIDGEKVRYEENHPSWLMPDGKLLKRSKVSLFNGTLAKTFYPSGASGNGGPSGIIEKEARQEEMKSYVLTPITMAFRGLNPAISPYLISEMKPSGTTLPIDGATCQEHVIKLSKDLTVSFWLDPGRDHVIRRIRTQRQGRLTEQADIRYRRDDVCGWVPASWVRNQYSQAGAVLTTTKVEVLDMRLNDPQAADQFDIRFPAGTWVHDQRNRKNYRVQPDETMRELSPEGEELPGSVAQPGDPWYRRHKWLLISLGVVLAAVVSLYAVRRKMASGA